jgi:uncharacterized protein (TIGR02996 family)
MAFDTQTRFSLIHGILSEPGEEAPRLVYADWLEEQGDPLGQIVRLHLEMGRPSTSNARRHALQRRERELLDRLDVGPALSSAQLVKARYGHTRQGWCYAIVDGVPLLWITPGAPDKPLELPPTTWVERFGWFTVHVGFYDSYKSRYEVHVDSLRQLFDWPLADRCIGLDMADVEKFYAYSEGLLARWPGATRLLRLGGFGGEVRSGRLTGLIDVDVSEYDLSQKMVEALAALPELRRLRVAKPSFQTEAVATLAGLSRLRAIDLSESRIQDRDALALAEGALHALEELNLEHSKITDDGALALIRSPNLARLRRLHLGRTNIGVRTIEELCRTDRLLRCGVLHLHGCKAANDMLPIVARSPHSVHLRDLWASASPCTDATALELARSPYLAGLVKLSLVGGQIGPDGVEALTNGSLPHLEELTLMRNPIGDRGALAVARFAQAKGEPSLHLSHTGVTAEGTAALVASGHLAGLDDLWLDGNPIGDAGAAVLAGCRDLVGLRSLWLSRTGLTDTGAQALLDSPSLPAELRLYRSSNAIGPDVEAALRQRFR